MQNRHVVTRLNFDDCVTRQCEVPNKKRAKISRSVLKTNLFRNKSTLESNCKNDLMQNCKTSGKILFADKIDENVPVSVKDDGKFILKNTNHDSLQSAEKNVTSIEHNASINTHPKGGMDLDNYSCLVSETALVEIMSPQLNGVLLDSNWTPNVPNFEISKIGNKYPHSPVLCKTQLVERMQKSPIIGSSKLKESIPSPILKTYSVKKSRRKHRMKTNVPPILLDTSSTCNHKVSQAHSSFKISDLCDGSQSQKHTDRMEEKLVLECNDNSEINSEPHFQSYNRDGKFIPTSPIIDTKNQRIKRNKTKKKYRGQKNCLGPDSEVKVLDMDKTLSTTIVMDILKFREENKLLDGKHPGFVKNCNESKGNSRFEKLNLSFENCIINAAESSLIYVETDSQNTDRENISFTQTSDSSAVTQNFRMETIKGYLSQAVKVCSISNFSGQSEISDNETVNHVDKTKTPEINMSKQQRMGKKSFICKTYKKSRSVVNSDVIQSPNEPVIECIETISSQESIIQKDEDIVEVNFESIPCSLSFKHKVICTKNYLNMPTLIMFNPITIRFC